MRQNALLDGGGKSTRVFRLRLVEVKQKGGGKEVLEDIFLQVMLGKYEIKLVKLDIQYSN